MSDDAQALAWRAVHTYIGDDARLTALALDWGATVYALSRDSGHRNTLDERRAWQTLTSALVDAGRITPSDLESPVGTTALLASLDVWGELVLDSGVSGE